MSSRVLAMHRKLFGVAHFVCGGHGARWPSDAKFRIPRGITVMFYVNDTESLPNAIGQKVDQVLSGGVAPAPTEVCGPGSECWDYRLFFSKAGGYLNLSMSSSANDHYITTDDKDNGIHLSTIIAQHVSRSPLATIHWSACRSVESGADTFDVDKPEYKGKIAALASKAGKISLY